MFDHLAGIAGCATDMQCEQIALIMQIGFWLALLGFGMIAAGLVMQYFSSHSRVLRRRARRSLRYSRR